MSQDKLICDRCGTSNDDPIAPCKRFYQNSEVMICDRCKNDNIWDNLSPIIWIENRLKSSGDGK